MCTPHLPRVLRGKSRDRLLPNSTTMSTKRTVKEVIKFLEKYLPCDLSDSLVHHGSKDGGFVPNLFNRSVNPRGVSTIGKAYTVLYAPKLDPRPAVPQLYIDEVPEDAFVVLALPPECQLLEAPFVTVNNALYGGLMSTRAQYRKALGLAIFGRVRDVAEHQALGYPVWSYSVGTTAPGPVVKVVGINVPLQIRTVSPDPNEKERIVTINPGDYLMADQGGMVRVEDNDQLDLILEYIPKRVEADTKVAEDIKNGRPAAEAQKYWRSKI